MSRECRTILTDDLLAVVNAMRGDEPRNHFLATAIRKGVRTMHAEASRNTPSILDDGQPTLGLAPLRTEGEASYYDPADVERIGALIDRLAL